MERVIVAKSCSLDDFVKREDGHFDVVGIPGIEGVYFRGSKEFLDYVETYLKEKKVDFSYEEFGERHVLK